MTGEIFSADFSPWMCVWQSTIFLVAGLLGSFLLRRHAPQAHQVVLLSMIAAVIAPGASALVKRYELGVFAAKAPAIESQGERWVSVDNHEATGTVTAEDVERKPAAFDEVTSSPASVSRAAKFPWRFAVLCGWIAASLILTVRLLASFILGVRLLGRARPLDCEIIERAVHLAKARLGISKDIQVCSSPRIWSPVIWCWKRRPVLLVPSAAGQGDNRIDWTAVLCHELAHWRRRDHISGLLAELVLCILPWQPLLWLAKSRLINLSEHACDDWVLATGQSGTDYAESLLDLVPGRQMAFVPGVVRSKKTLAGRVRRVLQGGCASPHSGLRWSLAVTLVAGCIAVGMAFGQTRPSRPTGTIKTKVSRLAVIEQPAFPVTMIKGRILDPNDEPAYGASIVALPVTSWGYYTEPRSQNKEGYFELPWSPTWIEQDKPIYLMAIVQDPKSQAALVEVKDPTSPVTVRLEPAFAITGKVVDPGGQQIEECLATISLSTKFKCQAPIYSFRGGRWWERMLSPLPYGVKYKLTVQAKGYQTRQIIVDGTDKSKKLLDLGTITLQPQDKTKPEVAEQYGDLDLEKEFHRVYSLDKDEIIKLIKAPFVLGRQEYFQNPISIYPRIFDSLESQGAIQASLLWDGKALMETSMNGYTHTHRKPRLEYTLLLTLRMPHYDFNLPKELNIEMPYGDWIVRADSPRNEQLRSLEEIIYAETNRAIRFEERTIEREVIVASGRYEFKPHPSGNYPNYIPLWDGRLQTSEYTVDSLEGLFANIEREIKMKIVDETEPAENATIRFQWVKRDPEPTGDKLSVLLDDLAKTTSLQFKVERRPGEIWVVTEAKGI